MKVTEHEIEEIINLYKSGMTGREVSATTGKCRSVVGKIVKGMRSRSEARIMSHQKGRVTLSDKGRERLSQNGKNAVKNAGKCWTKPERLFKNILNEINIGVKFPSFLKERYGLIDDNDAEIFCQYPLQRYVCDYVDELRKIVYSVNGDFWHANPLLYDQDNLTKIQKNNIRHDKNRKVYLESIGYNVCIVWESEIYWNKDLVKEKIKNTREMTCLSDLHSEPTAFDLHLIDWSEKLKKLWFKPKREISRIAKTCETCNKSFEVIPSKSKTKYCSRKCSSKSSIDRPTPEVLASMLWEIPTTKIAKTYGVTDKAIEKWAKQYNLTKPPRGYWAKLKH